VGASVASATFAVVVGRVDRRRQIQFLPGFEGLSVPMRHRRRRCGSAAAPDDAACEKKSWGKLSSLSMADLWCIAVEAVRRR
jgi:hypothetical protein